MISPLFENFSIRILAAFNWQLPSAEAITRRVAKCRVFPLVAIFGDSRNSRSPNWRARISRRSFEVRVVTVIVGRRDYLALFCVSRVWLTCWFAELPWVDFPKRLRLPRWVNFLRRGGWKKQKKALESLHTAYPSVSQSVIHCEQVVYVL